MGMVKRRRGYRDVPAPPLQSPQLHDNPCDRADIGAQAAMSQTNDPN
jgi:hypothetical protein